MSEQQYVVEWRLVNGVPQGVFVPVNESKRYRPSHVTAVLLFVIKLLGGKRR